MRKKHGLCVGCGKPIEKKSGCCRSCTTILRNKGRSTPPEQRFWLHVEKTDTCWLWTGPTNGKYGRHFLRDRKSAFAHRYSWMLHHGPIPDGLQVCHNCPGGDNPLCVNPAHLFLGTHMDNMADRQRKGRQARGERSRPKNPSRDASHHSKTRPWTVNRGEKTGHAKLKSADIPAIRQLLTQGVPKVRIAERYGVDPSTIIDIDRGRSWQHIL